MYRSRISRGNWIIRSLDPICRVVFSRYGENCVEPKAEGIPRIYLVKSYLVILFAVKRFGGQPSETRVRERERGCMGIGMGSMDLRLSMRCSCRRHRLMNATPGGASPPTR